MADYRDYHAEAERDAAEAKRQRETGYANSDYHRHVICLRCGCLVASGLVGFGYRRSGTDIHDEKCPRG